ncbi:MAG TPA: hypothetical protein VNF73_00845 [Candidatus Saccharimonadales bacterium]|nr:hypothetical protein [Candidatus Saccharimonadales bacterium]
MGRRSVRVRFSRLLAACLAVIALAGCSAGSSASTGFSAAGGSSGPAASGSPAASPAGSRLSSPAIVSIVQPTPNQVITGSTVHVVVSLQNATIVPVTTTAVRPDQGHVHLYVDNVLVSMNYGLTQDITVKPGTWLLKAEFVASDHAPFNPRVWSSEVLFTVK